MNFYKSAALALDHLDKHQGSVKGSLAAAGVKASGGEAKRILACKIFYAYFVRMMIDRYRSNY